MIFQQMFVLVIQWPISNIWFVFGYTVIGNAAFLKVGQEMASNLTLGYGNHSKCISIGIPQKSFQSLCNLF